MHNATRQKLQRIVDALRIAEDRHDIPQQIALYEELVQEKPDLPLGQAQLGVLYWDCGDQQRASGHFEKALTYPQNDHIDSLLFGRMAKSPLYTGDVDRAKAWYDAKPNFWRLRLYFENLNRAERFEEAEHLLLGLLAGPLPKDGQLLALHMMAQVYLYTGRTHDSVAACQAGLELDPTCEPLMFNLAVAQEMLGRYREAFHDYSRVLKLDPTNDETHNNLSHLMLRLGEFESGWRHYEWRWGTALKDQHVDFPLPRWQGEALAGRSLLVWREQGIGDQIMFSSMLPSLIQRGGKLKYEVETRLVPLLQRSFPDVELIQRSRVPVQEDGREVIKLGWPATDFQIPMGSLGLQLRPSIAHFPDQLSFLRADPQRSEQLRAEYQRLFPGKRLVGVSWRGGNSIGNQKQNRRIRMTELAVLKDLTGIQLINLQYGDTARDREEAASLGLHIHDDASIDPLIDLDAQAAQIAAMDLVISVDNTTVHLAGALGTPTVVLLQINPNWRWGLNEGPSYWYPSVHLIRNREVGQWSGALERAIQHLQTNGMV
ncbi:tetratricopeptide repeat protein [Pseudomonas nitroreducens]|uniref:Tetratricopeptide repeat protein n=1 Tax=Pseudomonas nitroreducens TaxID=46680 RepID=A0A5R9A0Q5_PSENT|nr:tetratricopeptide repeat-containing glycosyltransferase family protein [Pseudomonas nitroreducens]TLP72271.1 tetratricopeptide repeat protein [Pseudomonas nitroreducens]